ncbi:hypothetical protein AAVH_21791 [Aphelenchoides avenae]|nr:hypothetical protein AAVH_21791 [Aphelenchus avenae]
MAVKDAFVSADAASKGFDNITVDPPSYKELAPLISAEGAAGCEDECGSSTCSMQTTTSSVRRATEGGLHISQTIVQQCPHSLAAKGPRLCQTPSFSPPPSQPTEEKWTPDHVPRCVPLLDFLCANLQCQPSQPAERLRHPQRKRDAVQLLRDAYLLTTHLKPEWRNVRVICHDLTMRGAALLPAYGGFMNVKVVQHYYIRHRLKLDHPDLPCVAEYGPNGRRSYYPLEVLSVLL